MIKRTRPRWTLPALFIAMAILTACTPRAGAGEIAASATSDDLVLDLPTIIIDFDSEANATVAGLPLKTIAPDIANLLPLSAEQIQQLTAQNIQHIQLNNRANGLMLLVNGLSIPSARWNADSLMAMQTTLDALGVDQLPATVADLLPLIQQVGVAVVARFPLQDGAQALPLTNEDPNLAATISQQARDQFLASVGRAPTVHIPVHYTEDGSWSVNGLTENEYLALLPAIPWNTLHLSRASIQALQSADISQMDIAINQEGLGVSVNGNRLPHIGWSEGELQNLIILVDQMGLLAENGITVTPAQMQLVQETLLPMIQASDINLDVRFPQ